MTYLHSSNKRLSTSFLFALCNLCFNSHSNSTRTSYLLFVNQIKLSISQCLDSACYFESDKLNSLVFRITTTVFESDLRNVFSLLTRFT